MLPVLILVHSTSLVLSPGTDTSGNLELRPFQVTSALGSRSCCLTPTAPFPPTTSQNHHPFLQATRTQQPSNWPNHKMSAPASALSSLASPFVSFLLCPARKPYVNRHSRCRALALPPHYCCISQLLDSRSLQATQQGYVLLPTSPQRTD